MIPPNVVPEKVMGKPGIMLLILATVTVLSTELVAIAVVVYVVMRSQIAFFIIYGKMLILNLLRIVQYRVILASCCC